MLDAMPQNSEFFAWAGLIAGKLKAARWKVAPFVLGMPLNQYDRCAVREFETRRLRPVPRHAGHRGCRDQEVQPRPAERSVAGRALRRRDEPIEPGSQQFWGPLSVLNERRGRLASRRSPRTEPLAAGFRGGLGSLEAELAEAEGREFESAEALLRRVAETTWVMRIRDGRSVAHSRDIRDVHARLAAFR